jgi:hypothetical protein
MVTRPGAALFMSALVLAADTNSPLDRVTSECNLALQTLRAKLDILRVKQATSRPLSTGGGAAPSHPPHLFDVSIQSERRVSKHSFIGALARAHVCA